MVIPDNDMILNLINKGMGSALVMGSSLHYIIKQLDMLVDRRHHDLTEKKPGALISDDHPKIIWVRMLKRPKLQPPAPVSIFSLRGKFNSILEERLQDGHAENHYIISINVPEGDFDLSGELTPAGKKQFWTEITEGPRCFDRNEILLRRRKNQSSAAAPSMKYIKSTVKVVTHRDRHTRSRTRSRSRSRNRSDCSGYHAHKARHSAWNHSNARKSHSHDRHHRYH